MPNNEVIDLDEGVRRLEPLLQKKRLVVLAGSGISIDSGLPNWDGLLQQFIRFCESLPAELRDHEFNTILGEARGVIPSYPLRVASTLKEKLLENKHEYIDVDRVFEDWFSQLFRSATPNPNHQAIVATDYQFLITTNYDQLLEDAARKNGHWKLGLQSFDFNSPVKVARAIYEREPCIIHPHGDLRNIHLRNVVFTAEDYTRIKNHYPGFTLALKSLFLHYSLLFVGYGSSDPHLEDLMDDISEGFGWDTSLSLPRCYIFIHESKVDSIFKRYKMKRRTDFIVTDDYRNTTRFLQQLRDLSPRVVDP